MTVPHKVSLLLPCFNGGREALATTLAFRDLDRPPNIGIEAIITDDASTDGSTDGLNERLPMWAKLVRAPTNLGRGGALNLAAANASGDLLLILDCDCTPIGTDFLERHLEMLAMGVDVSIGNIASHGDGFWARYQSASASRRSHAARNKAAIYAMTTANIMLRADAFHSINGFDERYKHYGFEDRDFLLRMKDAGARLVLNQNAPVRHDADLDMAGIARKMRVCGQFSAPIFRASHPDAYAELGYAAVDASMHPLRAAMLTPLMRIASSKTAAMEKFLRTEAIPYQLRALLARSASALSYMNGTLASRSIQPNLSHQ